MGDFDTFKYGNASYPLDDASTNSLLRDADPALFYLLDFLSFSLTTHLEDRLLAEVAAVDQVNVAAAVASSVPFDPGPFLKQVQFKFPLLAAYRKSSTFQETSNAKERETSTIDVLYILPPMPADGMERIYPVINAAKAVIKNAIETGIHSAYIAPDEAVAITVSVWSETYANITEIKAKTAAFGAFENTEGLFFPALSMAIELREESAIDESDLEVFAGATIHEDLTDNEGGTVIADVVVVQTNHPDPTCTLAAPSSGSKAGGTAVTLTCTGLITGAPTTVFFGGEEASSVVVVSATSITCVTPPFTTFGATELVDVYVVNDGRTATLDDGFTFSA